MRNLAMIIMLFIFNCAVFGQTFTDTNAGLTGVLYSSVNWGDYDNDGDLDVLLSGWPYTSKIYRNDSSNFIDINAVLTGVSGAATWGDYDNDGDLDILLTGSDVSSSLSIIYRNDSGNFTDIKAGLVGVGTSSVAWGDYDNDGDLDILLTGSSNTGRISKIYRNDSGAFNDINAGLIGVNYGSVEWGDYDNDNDLDILLTGEQGWNDPISKIYRNDSGVFNDINAELAAVGYSSVAWGDYDNDGDLDILLTGSSNTGIISKIYRNDSGNFTDINADLVGVCYSAVSWGDYDNDGDLDILMTGSDNDWNELTIIYRNDLGNFTNIEAGLKGVKNSSVAWGDYDNDGDLDIVLSGVAAGSERISKIYSNESITVNNLPLSPLNLIAEVDQFDVTLTWDKAFDSETPQDGLSYNVYVGAASGLGNIKGSMSDQNGYRKIVDIGNTNMCNSLKLYNLHNGTYYWSVQSVDNCYTGSEFSVEQNFTIIATLQSPQALNATNILGYSFSANWERTSGATGYCIDVAIDSLFVNYVSGYNNLDVQNVITHKISGLSFGTDYYYRVRAYDILETSPNSNKVYLKTGTIDFTEIDAGFTVLEPGSFCWGDYDNDGDLDLFIAEEDIGWDLKSKLYRNDSGVFTEASTDIINVEDSYSEWGDYDNDGDLDLMLTGKHFEWMYNSYIDVSKIYRNDSGEFNEIADINGGISWGDYDNDGDLDILSENDVYRNDLGIFTAIGADIINGKEWGDFDNDGDLDVLSSSYVYRNDQGVFIEIEAGISNAKTWGDYGNDGDLDILSVTDVYRNDSGIFTNINSGFTSVSLGSVDWGDYDNDGDLDVLLTGKDEFNNCLSKIYRNDSGTFTDMQYDLYGIYSGVTSWADYDNDGDLDILITGLGYLSTSRISKFYRNDCEVPNTLPSTPLNLTSSVDGFNVTLSWDKAKKDTETLEDGLSYNIYVGRTSLNEEVNPSMSDIQTGYRKIVSYGNTCSNNTWMLTDLDAGTYYWSVQAIDNCFSGSAFAEEQSFTSSAVLDTPTATEATYITALSFVANWNKTTGAKGYYLDVAYDDQFTNYVSGYQNLNVRNVDTFNITGLSQGTDYYYSVRAYNTQTSPKSNVISLTTELLNYFEEAIIGLPDDISRCSYSWGDYDNDGDIDLLLTGSSSAGKISNIYRNDSGMFTELDAGLIGVSNGSAEWGDYDNDGDLDLILTGDTGYPDYGISKIYCNDSGVFTDINAGLTGVRYGSVAWGDYDNDGDLDLLLTGNASFDIIYGSEEVSKVYRNDSGIFTDIEAGLIGVRNSSVAWGDYDNDGDLDIVLCGYSLFDEYNGIDNPTEITKLYNNIGNDGFTDTFKSFRNVADGSVDFGDYDNDGDLDLLLTGIDASWGAINWLENWPIHESYLEIYKNNGNGDYERMDTDIPGVEGSASWIDFNNNGFLDILISGVHCYRTAPDNPDYYAYERINKLYKKLGNNPNLLFEDITEGIDQDISGYITFCDYDNDDDQDFITIAENFDSNRSDYYFTHRQGVRSYRNQIPFCNNKPGSPYNLHTAYNDSGIVFSWDSSIDIETPLEGLSYNLYIGTQPGLCDVKSPMSDISSGYKEINGYGNVGQDTTWVIQGLPEGIYYWSVQAVDNCFTGSVFAPEQTTVVTSIEGKNMPFETALFQNYPNPFNPETTIRYSLTEGAQVKLTVYDIAGREVAGLVDQKQDRGYHEAKFNGDMLTSGLYFYKLSVNDKVVASKKMMMVK